MIKNLKSERRLFRKVTTVIQRYKFYTANGSRSQNNCSE